MTIRRVYGSFFEERCKDCGKTVENVGKLNSKGLCSRCKKNPKDKKRGGWK